MQQRVLVGFNGSVESILSCVLLKAQGYQVYAFFLKLHKDLESQSGNLKKKHRQNFISRCSELRNTDELKKICEKQGFYFLEEDLSDEFHKRVVDPFIHDRLQSKKSLPCIQCHNGVLIKRLLEKAEEMKCEKVATGHYAHIENDLLTGQAKISKPTLVEMDQTFLLYLLTQEQLKKIIFPLGTLTQTMIKKLLLSIGLDQEISFEPKRMCFQKTQEIVPFIQERTPESLRHIGQIRNKEGDFMGEHKGLYCYSLGEKANPIFEVEVKEPLYIVGFEQKDHGLVVGTERDLYRKKVILRELNWVRPYDSIQGFKCLARITSDGGMVLCQLHIYENNTAEVEFVEPVKVLQKGAPLVFYEKDQMIGGGVIHEVFDFEFPPEPKED